MKKTIITLLVAAAGLSISAQDHNRSNGTVFPEKNIEGKVYTVSGYRHGVSFFPMVKYPQVEYVMGENLGFDKFHSAEVINGWLEKWASEYPGLVDLYIVAESYEGRPIYQVTITNKESGKDTDKPAAYFEGNRHSGEITSAESVMWLIQHLLTGFGNDEKVTDILNSVAIYARPINNPDGHNLYINSAQSNRSTVRPTDNDRDGLLDEDSPEDINGDGIILTMRWKDEEKGNMIPDPEDPTGRILKRVPEGEGIYRTSSEGWDNDGDGNTNEDGIGGLDLHRNYPENWRPESFDEATGRGYTQRGAGAYPMSEVETRSVVTFLLAHPNVYVVNSMDTRVPMHLRGPSTSGSEERMYPEDLEWFRLFDKLGKEITGYEKAGDVFSDYGGGRPLFGHGPDFGYWYYGAIWYGDELWNGARYKDYDGDDDIDQLDILRWDDEENNGEGFIEWQKAEHPTLGEVEVGGFHPKFFSQNPPPQHLLPWVKNQALFNLAMVEHLPRLEWGDIKVRKEKSYKNDSTDYKITVTFRNKGKLPTALKQALLVKIAREDQVTVKFDRELVTGEDKAVTFITNEEDNTPSRYGRMGRSQVRSSSSEYVGTTEGNSENQATFKVRVYGNAKISGKATVSSTRAGVLKEKEFVLQD